LIETNVLTTIGYSTRYANDLENVAVGTKRHVR